MKDYIWIKCRTLHSSGPSAWRYKEVVTDYDKDDEKSMEDFLDYQAELWAEEYNTHSEHFRGAEAEFETPCNEYLKGKIQIVQRSIKNKKEYIARMKKLIKENKKMHNS